MECWSVGVLGVLEYWSVVILNQHSITPPPLPSALCPSAYLWYNTIESDDVDAMCFDREPDRGTNYSAKTPIVDLCRKYASSVELIL
jgi:hypothetical protein